MNTRVRVLDLDTVWLQPGMHGAPGPGSHVPFMCLMEAISYIAGEPWSDRPRCVSPLLVGYGRMVNDLTDPHTRQKLKALIPSLLGTGRDRHQAQTDDSERTFLLASSMMRRWLPDFLERKAHFKLEQKVRLLPAVVDDRSAAEVRNLLNDMRVEAWAAGHLIGQAVDKAKMAMAQVVMEGIDSDVGYRNIGSLCAEAYYATHIDTNWDDALELFEELLQVNRTT